MRPRLLGQRYNRNAELIIGFLVAVIILLVWLID
jgi:tetrahydromethanopterin S-methyltransferase subunit F